jgi:hypothetical protein
MSFRKVARFYNILTPGGKPNGGMVKRLIQGYQPKRQNTLLRCGLLPTVLPIIIPEEPARRVLIGAWKMGGSWVSPEQYFGARQNG